MLEKQFEEKYPEDGEGMEYYIRTRTEQVSSNKASNFIFQTAMIYGAVVLVVSMLLYQHMDDVLKGGIIKDFYFKFIGRK